MLSSLIAWLKALWPQGPERPTPPHAAAAPAPVCGRCEDPLCGVLELRYREESSANLNTQSVWIRVDTKKLMARILENPDIDLDALQGLSREAASREPGNWHDKVRRISQAPPEGATRSGLRRRVPPPPSWH